MIVTVSLVREFEGLASYTAGAGAYETLQSYQCPACITEKSVDISHGHAIDMVEHLNDDHGWTREKIADWLAEKGY